MDKSLFCKEAGKSHCPGKDGLTEASEQLCCDKAVAVSPGPSQGACPSCMLPVFALGLEAEVRHRPLTALGGRALQQLLPSCPGFPETEELATS